MTQITLFMKDLTKRAIAGLTAFALAFSPILLSQSSMGYAVVNLTQEPTTTTTAQTSVDDGTQAPSSVTPVPPPSNQDSSPLSTSTETNQPIVEQSAKVQLMKVESGNGNAVFTINVTGVPANANPPARATMEITHEQGGAAFVAGAEQVTDSGQVKLTVNDSLDLINGTTYYFRIRLDGSESAPLVTGSFVMGKAGSSELDQTPVPAATMNFVTTGAITNNGQSFLDTVRGSAKSADKISINMNCTLVVGDRLGCNYIKMALSPSEFIASPIPGFEAVKSLATIDTSHSSPTDASVQQHLKNYAAELLHVDANTITIEITGTQESRLDVKHPVIFYSVTLHYTRPPDISPENTAVSTPPANPPAPEPQVPQPAPPQPVTPPTQNQIDANVVCRTYPKLFCMANTWSDVGFTGYVDPQEKEHFALAVERRDPNINLGQEQFRASRFLFVPGAGSHWDFKIVATPEQMKQLLALDGSATPPPQTATTQENLAPQTAEQKNQPLAVNPPTSQISGSNPAASVQVTPQPQAVAQTVTPTSSNTSEIVKRLARALSSLSRENRRRVLLRLIDLLRRRSVQTR